MFRRRSEKRIKEKRLRESRVRGLSYCVFAGVNQRRVARALFCTTHREYIRNEQSLVAGAGAPSVCVTLLPTRRVCICRVRVLMQTNA
jgi:hypothetical protein